MSIDTVGLLEKGVSAGAAAVLYNVTQHGETFSAASGIGMWAGATAAAASIASDILGPYLGIPRMFSEAGLSAVGWAYVGADKAGVVESTPKLMLEGAGFSIAGTLGQKWMAKTSMGGTYIKPNMVPSPGTGINQPSANNKGNVPPSKAAVTAVTSALSRLY